MNTPQVIIGAGFGGLKLARQLRNAPVQITLIDKQKISSRSRSQSDYKQVIHRIIPMKNLLKLEELFLFGLSLFLFSRLDYSWGWYALLFLTPDLSALGYLINPRVGSWTYNLIHHKGFSVALYVLGYLLSIPWLMFTGTILLGHSSLDRVFGYGLKYPDAFQNTHLGRIGR